MFIDTSGVKKTLIYISRFLVWHLNLYLIYILYISSNFFTFALYRTTYEYNFPATHILDTFSSILVASGFCFAPNLWFFLHYFEYFCIPDDFAVPFYIFCTFACSLQCVNFAISATCFQRMINSNTVSSNLDPVINEDSL